MSSFEIGTPNIGVRTIEYSEQDELQGISPAGRMPVHSWKYNDLKRVIDLSLGLVIFLLFAVPGLLIAAAILLTSGGPVFYHEHRIGRYGRPFRIWKFRSMFPATHPHSQLNASPEDLVLQRGRKNLHNPRITPIGRFLRRWSLDELPQIINVIAGDMSLIGPRPIVEAETTFYGDLLPFYLAATPGMSGLWQVSGRSNIDYSKRVKLDAIYVAKWSLSADLEILLQTLPAVLARTGAH